MYCSYYLGLPTNVLIVSRLISFKSTNKNIQLNKLQFVDYAVYFGQNVIIGLIELKWRYIQYVI